MHDSRSIKNHLKSFAKMIRSRSISKTARVFKNASVKKEMKNDVDAQRPFKYDKIVLGAKNWIDKDGGRFAIMASRNWLHSKRVINLDTFFNTFHSHSRRILGFLHLVPLATLSDKRFTILTRPIPRNGLLVNWLLSSNFQLYA